MKKLLKITLGTVRELKKLVEYIEMGKENLRNPWKAIILRDMILGVEITVEDIMKDHTRKGNHNAESKNKSFKEGKEDS